MTYFEQLIRANLAITGMKEAEEITEQINSSELEGLGKSTRIKLAEAGISSKEALRNKTEDELKEILVNPLQIKSVLNFLNK